MLVFFGLGEAVLQQTWRWNNQLKGEEEGWRCAVAQQKESFSSVVDYSLWPKVQAGHDVHLFLYSLL